MVSTRGRRRIDRRCKGGGHISTYVKAGPEEMVLGQTAVVDAIVRRGELHIGRRASENVVCGIRSKDQEATGHALYHLCHLTFMTYIQFGLYVYVLGWSPSPQAECTSGPLNYEWIRPHIVMLTLHESCYFLLELLHLSRIRFKPLATHSGRDILGNKSWLPCCASIIDGCDVYIITYSRIAKVPDYSSLPKTTRSTWKHRSETWYAKGLGRQVCLYVTLMQLTGLDYLLVIRFYPSTVRTDKHKHETLSPRPDQGRAKNHMFACAATYRFEPPIGSRHLHVPSLQTLMQLLLGLHLIGCDLQPQFQHQREQYLWLHLKATSGSPYASQRAMKI
ncbi:hypothetical protein VNO77_20248 [Canavalia gladiata]|uniref:Uncharacterized protein n=1 Tax=Canavalia gladiata TaxID=3824 RepID=A0AAN9LP95_CANGL